MSDSINRQAAIDTVYHTIFEYFNICEDDEESPITELDKTLLSLNKTILSRIKQLPSAERCGKWQFSYADLTRRELIYECSECGCQYPKYNYCPHCGARMTDGEG